jgi:probable phosphoglycerate mutase
VSAVTRVTIVRHGEALVNLEKGIAAEDCKGLTGRGRGQIEYAALHLAKQAAEIGGFDVLYASPRRRCVESAEPIAKALNLQVQFAPELRSLDHGPGDPWDPQANAIATLPPLAPDTPALDGAETWASYQARAGAFLTALPGRHPGAHVLIVAHAETQDSAIAAYFGLGPDSGARVYQVTGHTGISRWRHHHPRWLGEHDGGTWALLAHNDLRHLTATGLEPGEEY